MGSHSRKQIRNQRRRQGQRGNTHTSHNNSNDNNNERVVKYTYALEEEEEEEHQKRDEANAVSKLHLPACVRNLLSSTDSAELEEACNDLVSFAAELYNTTPFSSSSTSSHFVKGHCNCDSYEDFGKLLVESRVPQRLLSLITLTENMENSHLSGSNEQASEAVSQQKESNTFTKQTLYTQIAACSALRTLINNANNNDSSNNTITIASNDTNESENSIVNVLINSSIVATSAATKNHNTTANKISSPVNTTCVFTELLMSLTRSVWNDVEESAQFYAMHGNKQRNWQEINQNVNSTTEHAERFSLHDQEEESCENEESVVNNNNNHTKHCQVEEEEEQQQEVEQDNEEEWQEEEEEQQQQLEKSKAIKRKADNKLNFHFVHLRFFDELVQLMTVLVDSNESISKHFSQTHYMEFLLSVLQCAFSKVFTFVQQQQQEEQEGEEKPSAAEKNASMLEEHKMAELHASVAIAVSELLNAIAASDNAATQTLYSYFATLFGSNSNNNSSNSSNSSKMSTTSITVTNAQLLHDVIKAADLTQWLQIASNHICLDQTLQHLQSQSQIDSCALHILEINAKVEMLLYMLTEATINIQAMLISAITTNVKEKCNNNKNNNNVQLIRVGIDAVLPLSTILLKQTQPMQQWQQILPFLSQTCEIDEDYNNAIINLVKHRLHAVLLSLKLLHTVTNAICEYNVDNEDDEVAFRCNPLSATLYTSHTLTVFAEIMKDVLWLGSTNNIHDDNVYNNNNNDKNDNKNLVAIKQAHRALTANIDSNTEAKFLQYVLLHIEGTVWDVASILLLMIPIETESMGHGSMIWNALMACVQEKYKLLLTSSLEQEKEEEEEQHQRQQEQEHLSTHARSHKKSPTRRETSKSMVTSSVATRVMIWQQIESLLQLLWTLLRKSVKSCSNEAECATRDSNNDNSNNNNNNNHISVTLPNLKLLLALFNFSMHNSQYASTRLRQGLIGTLSLLSKALGTIESTKPVVECACALLLYSDLEINTKHFNNSSNNNNATAAFSSSSSSSSLLLSASTTPSYTPLLKLGNGIVESSRIPSAVGNERRQWISLLHEVDGVVTLRCEAANALIDLFIDERFDRTLYGPLQIQHLLKQFYNELCMFNRKRVQLSNLSKRNYKLKLEIANLEQWQELEENLCGFIQYKQQHGFA